MVIKIEGLRPKGSKGKEKTNFESLVAQLKLRKEFVLPSVFCVDVFGEIERDGLAMRVLLTMIWLSSRDMKEGVLRRIGMKLGTLKILSGFGAAGSSAKIIELLSKISGTVCYVGEYNKLVFESIEVKRHIDGVYVDWLFSKDIADEFISPDRYAILNIETISKLKKSMDFHFYRRSMLVKRMRSPQFNYTIDELRSILGLMDQDGLHRWVKR